MELVTAFALAVALYGILHHMEKNPGLATVFISFTAVTVAVLVIGYLVTGLGVFR